VTTNPYGSVTNTAALVLLPIDTPYASQVLSSGPIAYWKLNETAGTVFADSVQGRDGTFNATVTTGVAGPRPAAAAGFTGTNTAFGFNGATSDMTVPALNLGVKTITLTAWFNPAVVQADNAGLLFCRGNQTAAAGIDFSPGGDLGYTWNNKDTTYNWKSGLTPAIGTWNFVALVIEANQATMYLDTGSGLVSAVNSDVPHSPEAFDGLLHFGTDPLGNRLYQGAIDEVAIFGHALSATEIQNLHDAGFKGTATPVPVAIVQDPVGADTLEGSTVTLSATVQGSQPLTYQWQKGTQDIPGAVRSTLDARERDRRRTPAPTSWWSHRAPPRPPAPWRPSPSTRRPPTCSSPTGSCCTWPSTATSPTAPASGSRPPPSGRRPMWTARSARRRSTTNPP
jgi:hypothetical protein